MKYIYSAVFTPTEDGSELYASVPDLPGCVTTGTSIEDAIEQITDADSVWLVVAEDKGLEIPTATSQSDLDIEPGATFTFIQIDTLAYAQ